ncbi:MAG: hypothetical protein EAZ53_04645 [Bacteroidetes bacterium]|nr:MAG: hypothetical protein EAZ53_04645 [Bacteroidota bacterium]
MNIRKLNQEERNRLEVAIKKNDIDFENLMNHIAPSTSKDFDWENIPWYKKLTIKEKLGIWAVSSIVVWLVTK